MSTKHAIAADKFLQNSEKVTRHDQTFWSVRVKRDAQSQELPEWEDLREAASQIKKHTITHLADYLEMFEKNAEIEDVIFENIPDNMKYSESNPKGIKKAQFGALAELQAKTDELSMNGDAEKATDIVEKQCDKHHENSKNQEMLAIVTELILVGKDGGNTEPSEEALEEALGGTVEDEEPEEHEEREVEEQKPAKNLDNLVGEDMD